MKGIIFDLSLIDYVLHNENPTISDFLSGNFDNSFNCLTLQKNK